MTMKNITQSITGRESIQTSGSSNAGFIVSRQYDIAFFIGAPLVALAISVFAYSIPSLQSPIFLGTNDTSTPLTLFLGTFIMAHLVIVLFRSHGNPDIFKLHPYRFILVPLILIISITCSVWAGVILSVLATWWDVYHSSLQTFGLGRIYDMKAGNPHKQGRRLDYLLNILIYAGPILAGATLMDHVEDFSDFKQVGVASMIELPGVIFSHKHYLTQFIFLIGAPFICFYIYSYWSLYKRGYSFSVQKIILLSSTAFVSIFCWGFNSFGEAFFVMNFFHAVQYFAIVWHFEKSTITNVFRLKQNKKGQTIALALFIVTAFTYGYWATVTHNENDFLFAVILSVSLLHFWYDGFIWSVKKKQV
jgi:hypothetical protein